MKLIPLNDRLLVKRKVEEYKGLIQIPDQSKEKPVLGEVLSVGEGKTLETGQRLPMGVKAGDQVYFGKYSGTELVVDGQEILILREDEILAIVRE